MLHVLVTTAAGEPCLGRPVPQPLLLLVAIEKVHSDMGAGSSNQAILPSEEQAGHCGSFSLTPGHVVSPDGLRL